MTLRRRAVRCLAQWALACLTATAVLPAAAAPQQPPLPADPMAVRVLACTGCHGKEGRAAPDGFYPRIAGKPAGYLFHQLQAFQQGRRPYAPMTALVEPLSDDYLRNIAAHFAALDLPYAAPAPATAPPAVLQRGRQLALEGDPQRQLPACAACHGAGLMGVQPAIPALLGLPRDYVNAQIGAWRTGTRRALAPDCMAQVARRLAPEDVAAVSHWLAAQPVPVPSKPAASLSAPLPLACGGVAP
jgi:cytochrome c553